MITRAPGPPSRPGSSVTVLLVLLLLAAAATSRAAAIRGPVLSLPVTLSHTAGPPSNSSARDARDSSLGNICARNAVARPPSFHPEMDPLYKYLPPQVWVVQEEASEPREPPLPEGCQDVDRSGHKSLRCSGAHIKNIPDLSLERNVESLLFENTAIQVVSDLNGLPRSVRDLAFSNGPLVTFNGRRLYQVSGLEVLTIQHNTLNTWSFVAAFYSPGESKQAMLRSLYLHNNLITYPPQPMGTNETVLPHLETLVMSHNPMYNLPGNLFQPLRNSPLKILLLRNCSLSQFYDSPLEPVSGIEVLDLSNNIGLSNEEMHRLLTPLSSGRLRELYLANNNYIAVPTEALAAVNVSLEVLDLHGSAFQCLDNTSFPLMPKLRHLNLMYCRIAAIRRYTFDVFPTLETLNLDGNTLYTVPTEVLLPTLKVLTMSDNPRSTGDDTAITFTMEYVDFTPLEQLTNITFQGVPLDHVGVTYFNDLHSLRELRLTACRITHIEPFSFVNLTLLQHLYINDNKLEVLLNNTFAGLTSLINLDLSENNIVFRTSPDNQALASQPQQFRSGGEESHTLPQVLNWLQDRSELKRSVEDKDSRQPQSETYLPFTGLASLKHLDLSNNDIRILTASLWEDLQQLLTLSLKNNNVFEWYTTVFSNLSNLNKLVLSYNALSAVTDAMVVDFSQPSLEMVDLSHNTFQCDCSLKSAFHDINTSVFVDFSTYRCSLKGEDQLFDDYMNTVTCAPVPHEQVEETPNNDRVQIVLGSVCVFLLVTTTVTLYRKRWYLRYLVYKVKMKTYSQSKEDVDRYMYDIFVCYSQADRQWVFEHLVTKLEDGGRYRVCVHERDFTVGQEITENIITALDRSRKVVVVLSPAFVDSSWCMLELQLASNKILNERKDKLILVLLEALPSHRQPKKLRFLLRTRTYLDWCADPDGQRLFWVRLQRTLTKPTLSEAVDHSTHM